MNARVETQITGVGVQHRNGASDAQELAVVPDKGTQRSVSQAQRSSRS